MAFGLEPAVIGAMASGFMVIGRAIGAVIMGFIVVMVSIMALVIIGTGFTGAEDFTKVASMEVEDTADEGDNYGL